MAVSSRAMRSVPVTSRKMMKMLMILSRDRSNHTTICVKRQEEEENDEGDGETGNKSVGPCKHPGTRDAEWHTLRKLRPSHENQQPLGIVAPVHGEVVI